MQFNFCLVQNVWTGIKLFGTVEGQGISEKVLLLVRYISKVVQFIIRHSEVYRSGDQTIILN